MAEWVHLVDDMNTVMAETLMMFSSPVHSTTPAVCDHLIPLRQIRQPWNSVVPLLEIPMAAEHLIGLTRLVFDGNNRVTKGVGMYTVADGANRGTNREGREGSVGCAVSMKRCSKMRSG